MNLVKKLFLTLCLTTLISSPFVAHFKDISVKKDKINTLDSTFKKLAKKHLSSDQELSESTKNRIENYIKTINEETLLKASHELTLYESHYEIPACINSSIAVLCEDMLSKNVISPQEATIILNKVRNISNEDLSTETIKALKIIRANKDSLTKLETSILISGYILIFDLLGFLPLCWDKHSYEFSKPIHLMLYENIWDM